MLSLLRILITFWLIQGCVPDEITIQDVSPNCQTLAKSINWSDQIETLNRVSELFHAQCYRTTIRIANKAKNLYRYKSYDFIKEALEIFLPEGSVTDYVLESYERSYLSFLVALSYLKEDRTKAASVELNALYHEETARIYNHGQDPVNTLLQAVMWDNFPRKGYSSRPFWLSLAEAKNIDATWRSFAANRIRDIDNKKPSPTWQIARLGSFPALDWTMEFIDSKSGYFKISTRESFSETCVDSNSLLVPTKTWFDKIAMRHSQSYHPLVNAKTWIRLPVGITYGIVGIVSGAAIMVGGCSAEVGSNGDIQICRLSIEGGQALMAGSIQVATTTLKPDLRHWEAVPAGFFIKELNQKSTCHENHKDQLVWLL